MRTTAKFCLLRVTSRSLEKRALWLSTGLVMKSQYHKSCTMVSQSCSCGNCSLYLFISILNESLWCGLLVIRFTTIAKFPLFCWDLSLSVVKGRISSSVSVDLKLQMHWMATLQKRSLSNRANPTVTVCSDGFQLYFLWRLNPNKSFHLFFFQRSVHFGILSGVLIVLRGVSLCEIFPLPKTTECGKRWGVPTLAFLDFHPSLLQLMWFQPWTGQFSLPLSYIDVRSFSSNLICHSIRGWTQNEWYLQVWTVIPVRYFLTIEWQFIYASHKGCVPLKVQVQ